MNWIDYRLKLAILAVLILLALMKCWKSSPNAEETLSENRADIEASATEYLRLLEEEAFDTLEQKFGATALQSAMSLPVRRVESYELGDLRFEKLSADIDVRINNRYDAVLFLMKKEKIWSVGALKMRK